MVEPTEVERRLIESAQSGVLLNLSAEPARDVRAAVIRDLLRGSHTDEPDPRGVRLRGARIIGELDLADVRTEIQLTLQECSQASRSTSPELICRSSAAFEPGARI